MLLTIGFSAPAAAQNPEVAQTFYAPIKEDQLLDLFRSTSGATTRFPITPMHAVLSMVATRNGTWVYYDHWEDGFEADLSNPVQSSTLILGDGVAANGCAGDYFPTPVVPCTDADDLIGAGTILNKREDNLVIPVADPLLCPDPAADPQNAACDVGGPRAASPILWDGGDKIGASSTIAMTRTLWADNSDTLMAESTEVYSTTYFGTHFEAPVGEQIASNQLFEMTSFMVMASENNTTVEFDYDGDGLTDSTTSLNEGQAFTVPVEAVVLRGATVISDKPVQVQLMTGNVGATFAFDGFTLFDASLWSDSYFTPVSRTCDGSSSGPENSHVWIYNPNATAITVFYADLGGTGSQVIAAGDTFAYQTTTNSGAHFYTTDGSVFQAIGTMDSDLGAGESNSAWDWGYTLVPETSLSTNTLVGWGPGQDPTITPFTENGNPVWVVPVIDTGLARVYVDFDGDPATGLLTDPNGNKYDAHYDLGPYQSQILYDTVNGDFDQTGTRVYTVDGTLVSVAWGQDVCNASAGTPGLDVGTAVLPISDLDFTKSSELVVDNNGNGVVDAGDTLEYTLTITNITPVTAGNVELEDTLDANTTYVLNSTERDTVPVSDDGTGTPFPLDGNPAVYSVGTLAGGASTQFTFRVIIDNPLPEGVDAVTNQAVVTSDFGDVRAQVTTPIRIPAMEVVKTSTPENDPLQPGDFVDYVIRVTNTGETTLTNVTVTDSAPTGTTYVANSTFINAPVLPIRATEYYISGGDGFSSTQFDLELNGPLANDYFVIIRGSSNIAGTGPDANYVRLIADPNGTGDLNLSSGPNVIRLARGAGTGSWIGVVKVVEAVSATTTGTAGFKLLDVQSVAHTGTATTGTDTSGTAWSNINQVLLMGGHTGSGCLTLDPDPVDLGVCHARLYPSGTNTINWTRNANSPKNPLSTATSTVMVVEWGSEWNVQRVNVAGTNGGDKVDVVGEYNTAAISSVTRANTWVWGVGHSNHEQLKKNGVGEVITLGDGVTQNATETLVAAGNYGGEAQSYDVYVMEHPGLAVDYRFLPDEIVTEPCTPLGKHKDVANVDCTVDTASINRMSLAYVGNNAGNENTPFGFFSSRYIDSSTVRTSTQRAGVEDWAAWIQGIDFVGVDAPTADIPGGAPDTLATGYTLEPGQFLTVRFRVTVDSNPGVSTIDNTAAVSTVEDPGPEEASTSDPLGSLIGDFIWYDLDGDGVQDPGEEGIPGVDVIITPPAGVDIGAGPGNPVTVTTNADGFYQLILPTQTGTFTVAVDSGTLPAGVTQTGDPDSACPSTGCDGQTTVTIDFVGDVEIGADFGYQPSGSISGTIYDDQNTSGAQDGTEPGLPGVVVGLYEADGITPVLDSEGNPLRVTTDADGNYSFDNLPGGNYVVIVDPTGTTLPQEASNYEDPNGPSPNGDSKTAVALPAGGSVIDQNFGYDTAFNLDKQVDLSTAQPGDTLSYTLTPTYTGSTLLTDVTVTDVVPAGTTFVSAGQGGSESGGTVTWNLGSNDAAVGGATNVIPGSTGSFGFSTQQIDRVRNANSADYAAEITVDATGRLHSVFINNQNRTYYTYSTDNGATWSTAVQLPQFFSEDKDRNADIAVDSSGKIHVVVDNENKNVFYTSSTNSGVTWSTPVQIDTIPTADNGGSYPRIVVEDNDDLHVIFVNAGASAFYQTSTDGGSTWLSAPVDLPQFFAEDKDRNADIAVDSNGTIHVVVDNENKNVFYTSSTSGLTTGSWSAGVQIDSIPGDPNPPGADNGGKLPRIVVDNNDNLHVAFVDGATAYYQTSTDGGASWYALPKDLPQFFSEDKDTLVDLAVDACGVVHFAVENEGGKNAFYVNTADGGTTWSAIQEVDTAAGDSGDGDPVIEVTTTTVNILFNDGNQNVIHNSASLTLCAAGSTTSLATNRTMVSTGDVFDITMTLTAEDPITNVSPTGFSVVNATGGAACSSLVLVDGGPKNLPAGGSITFTWSCTAAVGSTPGELAFEGAASGTNSVSGLPFNFATATSNSVLMPPPLTFQVTVDEPPTVLQADNLGNMLVDGTNPVPSNQVSTEIPQVDLVIVKSAFPDPVVRGSTLVYTLAVTNNGPYDAPNVIVTDSLPAGVTWISTVPSQGACSAPAGVTCELGTIVNGGNATVTVTVTAN